MTFALAVLVAAGTAALVRNDRTVAPSHASTSVPTSVVPTSSVPSSLAPTTTMTRPGMTTTTIPYKGPKLGPVESVICADATHCWAGAGTSGHESAILASTDGGQTWQVQDLISGLDSIGPIECPSSTHCMIAGNRVVSQQPPLLLSTTDGGASWASQPMSSQFYELDGISCANDADCWLVGAQPENENDIIMRTTDGGVSWVVQDRSSITVSMGVSYGISCISASDCVVVGIGALTTTDGGATWTKHSVPGELNVVACLSESRCIAEEDVTSAVPANESTKVAGSSDGGVTWTHVPTFEGSGVGVLRSLSCPTPDLCLSVGGAYSQGSFYGFVVQSLYSGNTWRVIAETAEYETSDLNGVSCATGTTDCVAVGTGKGSTGVILRSTDSGSTWTTEPMPAPAA